MGGQEGDQVLLDTDRAHAWTTTAMRDAEGLVEVEMRNVGSVVTWTAQANLRRKIRLVLGL